MGDENSSDDPMNMGVDGSGEAEHDPTAETVGAVGGIHGVTIENVSAADHPDGSDGIALGDMDIPPEAHHSTAEGAVQEKLQEAYDAVTHPDTTAFEPNPITEQVDQERHAEEETDDSISGRHIINLPEQHF